MLYIFLQLNVYVYSMRKIIINIAILVISLSIISCTETEKLPPAVSSVEEAKTLLAGKTWQVVDVATVSGSSISFFDEDPAKKVAAPAPTPESLTWLSARKGADKENEFIKEFYDKNLKITIALDKDSVATTTGMDNKSQTYSIENTSGDDDPKGIKFLLTGEDASFADMGPSKFTATYYILGASEKKLYLLTPNQLNRQKVVFLLEAK